MSTGTGTALDYRSIIIGESARMGAALARGPLDAPVAGCPGWTLADLVQHLSYVQRWCTYILHQGTPPAEDPRPPVPAEHLPEFLSEGTAALIAALDASDLDAPAWNFTGKDQVKGFWLRRQALEVATHRWDADAAVGDPAPIEARLAADAIDEFLHSIVGRVLSRTKADVSGLVGDVHLHCTDTDGEWTFEAADRELKIVSAHTKAAAAVRAPASDLVLYLYNRVGADRVETFGDAALLQGWKSILRF